MNKDIKTWQERAKPIKAKYPGSGIVVANAMQAQIDEQAAYIAELESRPAAPVVAEGLVLAPLNPSSGMLERACKFDILNNLRPHGMAVAEQIYEAMIATWMAETAAHPVAGSPAEARCWSDEVPCDKCNEIGWHVCRPAAAEPMPASEAPDLQHSALKVIHALDSLPSNTPINSTRLAQQIFDLRAALVTIERAAPVPASEAAQDDEFTVLTKLPDLHKKLIKAYTAGALRSGSNGIDADAYATAEAIMREWDLPDASARGSEVLQALNCFADYQGDGKYLITERGATSFAEQVLCLAAPAAPTDAKPDELRDALTAIDDQLVAILNKFDGWAYNKLGAARNDLVRVWLPLPKATAAQSVRDAANEAYEKAAKLLEDQKFMVLRPTEPCAEARVQAMRECCKSLAKSIRALIQSPQSPVGDSK